MRKNLLSVGVLLLSLSINAQFLSTVGNGAVVTILQDALVYNGGGLQIKGSGLINNSGNIMLVGNTNDKFETALTSKLVLKSTSTSNYGQLYIDGFTQANLPGIVSKEYLASSTGNNQQMGLPFFDKTFSDFGPELGKTFNNTRYSRNNILIYDNAKVVSRNVNISTNTNDAAGYYMFPETDVTTTKRTLTGRPYAGTISKSLSGAGVGVNFGSGGNAVNIYNEKFNSYLGDGFDSSLTPWTGNYGKNIYQYANPYFTNIDLSDIYSNTGGVNGDGNYIPNIQGIRVGGTFTYSAATGTTNSAQQIVTFSNTNPRIPNGDFNALLLKPLQPFVIKLNDSTPAVLNFAKLRRFKSTARQGAGVNTVTSAKSNSETVKQLSILALDADGVELGRTYFVAYSNGVSGHTENANAQFTGTSNAVIGTFEEDVTIGGIDNNYSSRYWLYINEVNEMDFKGKPLPLAIYGDGVKSLKFEIHENASKLDEGIHNLSAGIGFYYKALNGDVLEVSQDQIIPITSDQYSLFYGKPDSVLSTSNSAAKTSRTQVAFNKAVDNYIVRFDPLWKKSDIQVFDMSGRVVFSKKNISTDQDFVLPIDKGNNAYIVTAVSDKGEVATAKVIR